MERWLDMKLTRLAETGESRRERDNAGLWTFLKRIAPRPRS